MWQRFTERARKVVFYAQEEAQKFGENYVSTEHLLLGLVRESDSVAATILVKKLGLGLSNIRTTIEKQIPQGDARPSQDMTLTPRAKRVIDLAYDEARNLNNNYIGTEHLLLGLIREGEGLAGRVLAKLGIELEKTRREVIELQEEAGEGSARKTATPLASLDETSLREGLASFNDPERGLKPFRENEETGFLFRMYHAPYEWQWKEWVSLVKPGLRHGHIAISLRNALVLTVAYVQTEATMKGDAFASVLDDAHRNLVPSWPIPLEGCPRTTWEEFEYSLEVTGNLEADTYECRERLTGDGDAVFAVTTYYIHLKVPIISSG